MKKAGSKNNGAWFRFNKFLKTLDDDGAARAQLAQLILQSNYVDNAFNALEALIAETGVGGAIDGLPASAGDWVAKMCAEGIPLQVWMGKLTTTTYAKTADGWRANYQSPFHYFAKDLRKICRNFVFAFREVADLVNDAGPANPGGLPDATKGV